MLQTATGAGISWFVARDVLGHHNGFFAPVAALVVLGLAPGTRSRRTVEMVLGVAVGIAVGDALISVMGSSPGSVALVVLLAMAGAILLGGGPLAVSQAATSATLVGTVMPPSGAGFVPTRFVDALVGGAIGLLVLVVAPRDPVRLVERAARPVITQAAATLEDVATALAEQDAAGALRALNRARSLDALSTRLMDAIVSAREIARISPSHWHDRAAVRRYARAAPHLDLTIRNVRVLARAAVRAVELGPPPPPHIESAIRDLAGALRLVAAELAGPDGGAAAEALVLQAAEGASRALDERPGFAVDVLIGQIRSLATDLLAALGAEPAAAVDRVRRAAEGTGRR
ncbi:MAG: aromatic acid exporter family protein [Actinobacteria bacterium]|uniref:Unannotated protein n=1 Tax=freshwater metagenome TaxID=449393 RepID=A0A6J6NK17_9ZZZZ|nr:aromatic acid exporter family protein [Actinomycetota bacterium]